VFVCLDLSASALLHVVPHRSDQGDIISQTLPHVDLVYVDLDGPNLEI